MSLPSSATLDDVKVRIRQAFRNPNVGRVEQIVLKEGPRAFRLATLFEIVNPETGEHHHYSLKIDSINRRKDGWFYKPEKSVSLDGEDPSEIERLGRFLQAHLAGLLPVVSGDLHIIKATEYDKLTNLLELIPDLASPDMVELLKLIVPRIDNAEEYAPEFVAAFASSDTETVQNIGVAAQLVSHRREHAELQRFVETSHRGESDLQDLLERNPWMFGSEYSERLDRRRWTRDENLDFMLRRTADNYLEVIEIKTPFEEPLFLYDKSHDSYYPSSRLSPVLGQVMRYIEELERNRDLIRSKDGHDTLKVRARIVLGRDGDQRQQEALRNLNAHLHRIEVLTFDQLLRISQRVLDVFGPAGANERDDEGRELTPF